jgi:3-(3-hydroxy-phenyl)propionate hydroxylase
MSNVQRPVVIAGAGPVGMTAAADLVRQGIPVTVLEKSESLSLESRASTFHPPTLDMLDDLGFAEALVAQGLKAPQVQYGSTTEGELGTFDFSAISDLTRHPFRLQAEQFKLTRIILDALQGNPLFEIRFGTELSGLTQDAQGVDLALGTGDSLRCEWLIGADGANSVVRRHQEIAFDGFTWPERFLVVTTSADIATARPGVTSVSYWADPQRWHFLLRIIGAWRVMLPVPAEMSDDEARTREHAERSLASVLPPGLPAPIEHITLYRVHQRVAASFRNGRTFLAGDSAHINNPLGGMGMNGGLHDAISLTNRLIAVWHGKAGDAELDGYEIQRRPEAINAINAMTESNKKTLEERDPAIRRAHQVELRQIAADPKLAYEHLLKTSMIASLRRSGMLK